MGGGGGRGYATLDTELGTNNNEDMIFYAQPKKLPPLILNSKGKNYNFTKINVHPARLYLPYCHNFHKVILPEELVPSFKPLG